MFIASIVSYYKGYKQARLFILGFSVVLVSHMIILLDSLGIISFVYQIQNILLIATSIESIILSITFIDSYRLLQESKLKESKERENLILKNVEKQTIQLKKAATTQDLLFKELHHRVKNNLQLILSITRLQKAQIKTLSLRENFDSLERRISAIAATHNTILINKKLDMIDMKEYITQLTLELKARDISNKITFNYDIDTNMKLKRAVNIGLIINELVSNALKHAFVEKKGEISIILYDDYLEVSDNGIGYNSRQTKEESLGLKLVNILVIDQLKGSLEIVTTNGTKFIIRFKNG